MQSKRIWSQTISDNNQKKYPIYAVQFTANGAYLLCTAGQRILVFQSSTGEHVKELKGHKEQVLCLSGASDGSQYASGSMDKSVILWDANLSNPNRYTHPDPVHAMAHNPIYGELLSCSSSATSADGVLLKSQPTRELKKFKVSARVTCCSWSSDGQKFALGYFTGVVSIRNRSADQLALIDRSVPIGIGAAGAGNEVLPMPSGNEGAAPAPVWSIAFHPAAIDNNMTETLAIADWNQKLSFYDTDGRPVGRDRSLGFDPCSVAYLICQGGGEYIVIGGADRRATLWSKEGFRLGVIADTATDWVWCVCPQPRRTRNVAVAAQDGTIALHEIQFQPVHALHLDRFAYRENMTDVIIQQLTTEQKARIKCRDHVLRISVFKDKLAVQLPDKVIVYELFREDTKDPVSDLPPPSAAVAPLVLGHLATPMTLGSVTHASSASGAAAGGAVSGSHGSLHALSTTASRFAATGGSHHTLNHNSVPAVTVAGDGNSTVNGATVPGSNPNTFMPTCVSAPPPPADDLQYRIKSKFSYKAATCSHLVVTSCHIVVCHSNINSNNNNNNNANQGSNQDSGITSVAASANPDRRMRMHLLQISTGIVERTWTLDAGVSCLRVVGGARGRDALLVGLVNGVALMVWTDNPFPVPLLHVASTPSIDTNHQLEPQQQQQQQQQSTGTPIKWLDVSASRTKLAVVDAHAVCSVYDITTRQILYQEPDVVSVAWNTEHEDTLCFSGGPASGGLVHVKTGPYLTHTQTMPMIVSSSSGSGSGGAAGAAVVAGFTGSRIYGWCDQDAAALVTLDIPHAPAVARYLDRHDVEGAYAVACLGITEAEWKNLGMQALEQMAVHVARKAFTRIRDLRSLDLVAKVEEIVALPAAKADHEAKVDLAMAEIQAYRGAFAESARLFKKAGHAQRAIDMYSELNMWDNATQLASDSNGNTRDILQRKAQMLVDRNDLDKAAATFLQVGECLQAVDIIGAMVDSDDKLVEIARSLPKTETKALSRCVYYFRNHGQHAYAAEILVKMGDIKYLMNLHIELKHWDDAFKLAETHPELVHDIYLPYAHDLAHHDRFIEAQENYRKAGRTDVALRVLQQLTTNAVTERRFDDAAHYYWILASEHLQYLAADLRANSSPDGSGLTMPISPVPLTRRQRYLVDTFYLYYETAELYYAFHFIQRYIDEPFTTHLPESLFNMARFILHQSMASGRRVRAVTLQRQPQPPPANKSQGQSQQTSSVSGMIPGDATAHAACVAGLAGPWQRLSTGYTLLALAKQSTALGAHRLARICYDKLQHVKVPPAWRDSIDSAALAARAKPNVDAPDLLPMCPRCSSTNPLLNTAHLPHPHSPQKNSVGSGAAGGMVATATVSTATTAAAGAGSTAFVGIGGYSADECVHCREPFVRSFYGFETLPLVEFVLEAGIDDAEAARLIQTEPLLRRKKSSKKNVGIEQQRLRIGDQSGNGEGGHADGTEDEEENDENIDDDPFTQQMLHTDVSRHQHHRQDDDDDDDKNSERGYTTMGASRARHPIRANRAILVSMSQSEVFVKRWPQVPSWVLPPLYYRCILPDVAIKLCTTCNHFFYRDDFEFIVLQKGHCPFCRTPSEV